MYEPLGMTDFSKGAIRYFSKIFVSPTLFTIQKLVSFNQWLKILETLSDFLGKMYQGVIQIVRSLKFSDFVPPLPPPLFVIVRFG